MQISNAIFYLRVKVKPIPLKDTNVRKVPEQEKWIVFKTVAMPECQRLRSGSRYLRSKVLLITFKKGINC